MSSIGMQPIDGWGQQGRLERAKIRAVESGKPPTIMDDNFVGASANPDVLKQILAAQRGRHGGHSSSITNA